MRFYLGTHHPGWLNQTDVPLFISHTRLGRYRIDLPRARGPWALDSGGFSELTMYGEWRTDETLYLLWVKRYIAEVGRLEWCAPQDWMCEPFITAKTGLDVAEHQRRTLRSYLNLRGRGIPVIPVLQGFAEDDYLRCAEMYASAGVDLASEEVVGVGSVCRRQGTREAERIFRRLHAEGFRCHGFGVKVTGLASYGHLLTSADSMAWSRAARHRRLIEPCPYGNASCANCLHRALEWREGIIDTLGVLAA